MRRCDSVETHLFWVAVKGMKPMAESDGRNKESLLFLLLAHHRSDKLHRTIHIRLGQRDLHLCARGLGRYSGFVAAFVMNGLLSIPRWLYPFSFVFFPLPSTIDWVLQKTCWRESRNAVRVPTGFLLGVSQGLLIVSFLQGLTPVYTFGVGVLLVYFLCFCIARYWKRSG